MKLELPPSWTLDEVCRADLGIVRLWADPSVRDLAQVALPFPAMSAAEPLPDDLDTLIVVGGGTWIDEAKVAARSHANHVRLIAIPSLWGSGAEASPVAVLNRGRVKEIHFDPKFVPDVRVTWSKLAESVPPRLARDACGDCWSHALEGFLSPLAGDCLRQDLAGVMCTMLELPLTNDPRWFEVSARACAGQAKSSVGLIHGIAHTLEGPLRADAPAAGWGHARLCTAFLLPVMTFNRRGSSKWGTLAAAHGLDETAIFQVAGELFDLAAYDSALPTLTLLWSYVLRDRCTRTNGVLVRPGHLAHFEKKDFS